MKTLKMLGKRLRRPKVLLSLVSQIVTILVLFGYQVDEQLINGLATACCSILVTLGILFHSDKEEKNDETID